MLQSQMIQNVFIMCTVFSDVMSSAQVRLQTQPKARPGEVLLYNGTFDCFKKTLAKEVRLYSQTTTVTLRCLSESVRLNLSV